MRQFKPGQLQTGSLYNISASYAITASHSLTNSPAFPFTGSARITGSLGVTGSISTTTGFLHIQSLDSTNRILYDSNEVESIQWRTRALVNINGGEALNWDDGDNVLGIRTIPISEQLSQQRINDQLSFSELIANGKIATEQTIEEDARINGTIVYYNGDVAEWQRLEGSVIINSEPPVDNILGIVIERERGNILLQGNITFKIDNGTPLAGFPPVVGAFKDGDPLYLTSGGGYTTPVSFSIDIPDGAVRSMGYILQSVTDGGLTNGIISFNPSNNYFRKISGISRIDQINGQGIYAQYAVTADQAISSSFATTASYVNPLNQNVILTGSFNVSGSTTQVGNNNLLGTTNLSGSIVISGSIGASANLSLGGTLRLDPAQDPGNTNATASFLFTSASNTAQGYDLYYRQDGNLVKFKWLEGGISSGLLYGGIISASGATIYVSSGSGVLLDPNANFSSEISPQFTSVTWPNYSASATYLTSSQNTYLYVDAAGTIHQQTGFFDQTQYEQAIPLGRVTHPNYATITGIGSNVQTTYDSDNQQSAFIRAFGPLKIDGFSINAHPGTLGFGVGSGVAYTLGGFYSQDPNSPSHYHGNAFATSSIARAYRSGSGVRLDNNGGAFYSTVDPDYWDDGTGVLNTMAAGDWQIQRVFANPVTGRVVVYYGQTTYTTLLNALQYLATDSFTEGEFTAHSLIFVGYLVLKGQTNNLTDTNNNRIINAGIFRNIAGGSSGGGAVAQTLNDLGDVTITTPSNGQALIYNSGTWENGTPSLATTASYVLQAVSASNATSALTASFIPSKTVFNQSVLGTGNIGFVTRSFTQGPTVTGTISEVQVFQLLIPSNTFSATDKLTFFAVFNRPTAAGTVSLRAKMSTSSSMPSSNTSLIARLNPTANQLYAKMARDLIINDGNIKGFASNSTANNDVANSTVAMSSQSLDVTVDNYFYLSVQPATGSDEIRLEAVEIKNI
jgi:hypothetical protein